MRKGIFLLNVLLVLSLLLAACAGRTEVPVAPTVTPTEPTATTEVTTGPAYKDPDEVL
jgi:outer membrane biogenesis lipoprotein LolB